MRGIKTGHDSGELIETSDLMSTLSKDDVESSCAEGKVFLWDEAYDLMIDRLLKHKPLVSRLILLCSLNVVYTEVAIFPQLHLL